MQKCKTLNLTIGVELSVYEACLLRHANLQNFWQDMKKLPNIWSFRQSIIYLSNFVLSIDVLNIDYLKIDVAYLYNWCEDFKDNKNFSPHWGCFSYGLRGYVLGCFGFKKYDNFDDCPCLLNIMFPLCALFILARLLFHRD